MTGSSGRHDWPTALLVLLLGATAAAAQPARPGDTANEAELWQRIASERDEIPEPVDPADWFVVARDHWRGMLRRVELYQRLYPGGAHRDAVVATELQLRYNLGVIAGGEFTTLDERTRELLADPPSDPIAAEAAYWQLLARHFESREAALRTQPTASDPLITAYRAYLATYPASRHSLRLAAGVFDAAAGRGDLATMRAMRDFAAEQAPGTLPALVLDARLRRRTAIGRPFPLEFGDDPAARSLDLTRAAGRPTLIVVWAAFDEAALRTVRAVSALRRQYPRVHAIGVNVDPDQAGFDRAVERLGLDWPQLHDGLGWGAWFVRHWAVRRVPTVFVLTPDGTLAGISPGQDWQRLLRPHLEPARPETRPAAAD